MYYEKGAAMGEAQCCFELGYFFDQGMMGLDVDKAEARRYFTLIFCALPQTAGRESVKLCKEVVG